MSLPLQIQLETFSPAISLNNSSHLWLLDLTQLTDEIISRRQAFLSDAELLRAQTFKHRKLQFIALRAFVRMCLAHYTDTAPGTLVLATEPNGKPYLINASLPIVFNLSHSNDMVVLAVGLQHALGVDIETTTRKRSQHAIAERYFHPNEVAHLQQLTNAEHSKYFFQLWTLKEAFLKATGEGISGGLNKTFFTLKNNNIHAEFAPELTTAAQDWQFYQQFINTDYCVALARNSNQLLNIHWLNGSEFFNTSTASNT